jgi:hypothetical protein
MSLGFEELMTHVYNGYLNHVISGLFTVVSSKVL